MSTISTAASVHTPTVKMQAVASSSSSSTGVAQGSDDMKSFAHWLKESSDGSDKEDQTAITPWPSTSPNKAAIETKEPRRRKTDEAPASLLTNPVAQAPVIDPRGLTLSIPASSTGNDAQTSKPEPEKALQEAVPTATAPVPTPIAFGVTIPKPADKPAASVTSPSPAASSQSKPVDTVESMPDTAPVQENPPVKAIPVVSAAASAAVQRPEMASVASSSHPKIQNKPAQSAAETAAAPVVAKPQPDDASAGHKDSQSHNKNRDDADVHSTAASKPAPALHQKDVTPAPVDGVSNTQATLATSPAAVPTNSMAVDSVKSSSSVQSATPVQTVAEPQPNMTSRPHSIDIRIGGADSTGVDVRVSQRAGDVQVTVRTPDTGLAQSLRDHLPELSDRLSQTGVHGDVWQSMPAQTSADTGSQSGQGDPNAWQGQQQNQQQQGQQQEQAGSQQQNQPQTSWLSELDDAEKGAS